MIGSFQDAHDEHDFAQAAKLALGRCAGSGQERAGQGRRVTQRDIDGIFKPLTRYRYLPVDYIHALGGGSLDYLVNRLNLLCREPNRYVARPPQQRANATPITAG